MKKEKINIGNILNKNQLNNITINNNTNNKAENKLKKILKLERIN